MKKIIRESLQDIANYLRSSDLKSELEEEYPDIVKFPEEVEYKVNDTIVNLVDQRFPDESLYPRYAEVIVLKIQGEDTEVVSSSHEVIEYNGVLYDYTAHQFTGSFNELLNYRMIPVTQPVVTNDNQLNQGISSVKYYAMLKK